jgi:hypothetical protein
MIVGVRGCVVGCGIKSINKLKGKRLPNNGHKHFETELGIPEWLAKVQDTLFEGVSEARNKTWPVEFSEAINTGADLDKVKVPFIVYILAYNVELQERQLETVEDVGLRKVIEDVIAVNQQMIVAQKSGDIELISAAWSAVYEKYADYLLVLLRNCK